MLQQVYDGAWHLPGVAFLSVTLLFIALARRSSFMVGFSALFGWLIAIDAWANGANNPVPEGARLAVAIFFVVLGDWRYFLLLERYSSEGLTVRRAFRSLAFAVIVPIVTLAAIGLSQGKMDMRSIFFFYEVAFFVLAVVIFAVILPRFRTIPEARRTFLNELTLFVLAQYALWAVADILLISGHSWAMAIRLTANIFYYALFIPFAWWRSPESPGRRTALPAMAGLTAAALALSFVTVKTNPAKPAAEPVAADGSLDFRDGDKLVSTISMPAIRELPVEDVTAFDPYYQHNKHWKTVSIENLLRKGLGREPDSLASEDFVLRAMDGFAAYMPGKLLLEGGAYVAFADLDVPEWEPIGPRKDNPGPFYLVWSKPEQQKLETHARPWQLASIELVTFDSQFPHVRPTGSNATESAGRGFQIFRIQCLACHAINREGGQVGPELNVPRNILEYRDPVIVRDFIKNPLAFRYTVMPSHPDLTRGDLDDLIAYLGAMKNQKHDRSAPAASGGSR